MNNNMNFDPITGQPIQNNIQQPVVQPEAIVDQQSIAQTEAAMQPQANPVQQQNNINNQMQFQNIPTIEQSKQEFINNIQEIHTEKKEEKKEKINFGFIIILFIVLLVAIYFLFPLLLDYI